jgi:hypothetical protein
MDVSHVSSLGPASLNTLASSCMACPSNMNAPESTTTTRRVPTAKRDPRSTPSEGPKQARVLGSWTAAARAPGTPSTLHPHTNFVRSSFGSLCRLLLRSSVRASQRLTRRPSALQLRAMARHRVESMRLRGGGDDDAAAAAGDAAVAASGDAAAAAGDTKKEKKGLFDSLNPFSKDNKEDPKEAQKRKDMEEQKKKEEAAAKAKKEELEKQKAEREEAQETARQAAKRERYQQLLQKNPDATRRVFQFSMKAMKLDLLSPESTSGLFLKVTLGGNYVVRSFCHARGCARVHTVGTGAPAVGTAAPCSAPACTALPRRMRAHARNARRRARARRRSARSRARAS